MRCKPDDLAVILSHPHEGHLVTVLHAAPAEDFRLPDDQLHVGCGPGHWVCESMGGGWRVPMSNGKRRQSQCAVIEDWRLRPLRDDPGADETLTWVGKPEPETFAWG